MIIKKLFGSNPNPYASVRLFSRYPLVGAGVIAVGVACSSTSSNSEMSFDEFCNQKANAECQVAPRCGAVKEKCLSARVQSCTDTEKTQTTGTRSYRAANSQACIDATQAVYAKTLITPTDMTALDDVCSRVFAGTTPALAACSVDADCTGTLICDKSLCAAEVTKKTSELCGNPGEVCEAGSYCAQIAGGSRKCLAKGSMGADCNETTPCLESLRCDGSCEPRADSGQSCSTNDDCASTAPYCDPYLGKKCDAGLAFAPGAAACNAYGSN